MRFGSPWVGAFDGARYGTAGILGPPNYQFLKKTTHHTPQTSKTLSHALRASVVADKGCIKDNSYPGKLLFLKHNRWRWGFIVRPYGSLLLITQ